VFRRWYAGEDTMAKARLGQVAIVALSLIVGACSTSGSSPSTSAVAPTEAAPSAAGSAEASASAEASSGSASQAPMSASGKINAFGVSYETSDVIAKARIDLFKKKYPDVELKVSESSFDPQAFVTSLQSSNAPDVVRMSRDRIGTYVASGVLEPLTDCISKAGVNMSDYREAAVKQVTFDDTVYGMPEFFWVSNWLVDDDLFKQAGLDPATWDVGNWDQISAANTALMQKTKTKVAIDPKVSNEGDRFPMWVAAAGGQMLSDDGTKAMLDSQQVIDALTFTKSLIDAQGGLTAFKDKLDQTGDFFGKENGFKNNLEAAFPMQQWYLNVLATASPDTKITVKPFMSKTGQPVTMAEGDALAIVSKSQNKDAACAFITTMTSTEAWVAAATQRAAESKGKNEIQTGTSTGNKVAEEQIFSSLVDVGDNTTMKNAIDTYFKTFDSAFARPATRAAEDFRTAWIDGVNAALSGQKDPATAMKDAQQTAQSAIDAAQ
jgi:multiple sugar transport system substrate-binding protein